MRKIIKNKQKMKNTMYIIFGTFAIVLFAITKTNPSYAEEGIMLDNLIDSVIGNFTSETTGANNQTNIIKEDKIKIKENEESEEQSESEDENEHNAPSEMTGNKIVKDTNLDEHGEEVNKETTKETINENEGNEKIEIENRVGNEDVNRESVTKESENIEPTGTNEENKQDKNQTLSNKLEKNSSTITQNNGIKITFNLSGGYRVEDDSTGSKVAIFQTDSNNMVGTTNRRTPSRNDECDENGEIKKCMFDGRYLEDGSRRTGYAKDDMTVYAKWLPFEDLQITIGGITFTVMDRNIGATETGACTNEDKSKCGYHFQRGNNYGFKPCNNSGCTSFPNGETTSTDTATDRQGHTSTYYNGIRRTTTPWNHTGTNSDNLWGGGDPKNPDTDKQGPCPSGYHIPNSQEIKKFEVEYAFAPVELFPYGGHRKYNDASIFTYYPSYGPEGDYRYSDSVNDNNSKAFTRANGYFNWIYHDNRSDGFSIRCFKDTEPNLNVSFYIDNEKISEKYLRWREPLTESYTPDTPIKENATFKGRYKTEDDNIFIPGPTKYISQDIALYAKYECELGYIKTVDGTKCEKIRVELDANGGKFNNNSKKYNIETIIQTLKKKETKIIHTPNLQDDGEFIEVDTSQYWRAFGIIENGKPLFGDNYSNSTKTVTGSITFDWTGNIDVSLKYGGAIRDNCANIRTGNNPRITVPKSYNEESYTINSDSVSIGLYVGNFWDGYSNHTTSCYSYGYHLKAEREGEYKIYYYPDGAFNNIPEPTREGHKFMGRYFADNTEFNTGNISTGEITYLHAKRECAEGYENKGGDCIRKSGGTSGGGGGGGGSSNKTEPRNNAGGQTGNQINSNTGNVVSSGVNEKEPEGMGSNIQTGTKENDPLIDDSNVSSGATLYPAKHDEDSEKTQNSSSAQEGQTYTQEFQDAYEFAKGNGITTMSTIQNADMDGKLTRIAMAKMLSQYAMNVLGKQPDISKGTVKFSDVTNKLNQDYDNGVVLAYQLGIMGQNMPNNKFRPNDEVTRAEFATALSRMMYNTSDGEYKGTGKYYLHHMERLINEGIITKDNPNMKELRGYVMIMLMRTAK